MTTTATWRRVAAIGVVGVYLLLMWIGFLGLVDFPAGLIGPGHSHVIDGSYGTMTLIVIPAGFLAQVRLPPDRVAGVHQIWAAALALSIAGLLATEYRYLALAVVVALGGALLVGLQSQRRRFIHPARGFVPVLAGLTVLGMVPWLMHGLRMASNARALEPPRDAETNAFHHWTAAAALAVCVILLLALASAKIPGWRLPAFTAALAGAVFGISSTLYPHDAGSAGRVWGVTAVMWCVVLVGAVLSEGSGLRPQRT